MGPWRVMFQSLPTFVNAVGACVIVAEAARVVSPRIRAKVLHSRIKTRSVVNVRQRKVENRCKSLARFRLTYRVMNDYRDFAVVVTGSKGVPGRDTFEATNILLKISKLGDGMLIDLCVHSMLFRWATPSVDAHGVNDGTNSHAIKTIVVEESIHVLFDDSNPFLKKENYDDDVGIFQEQVEKLDLNIKRSKVTEEAPQKKQQIKQIIEESEPSYPMVRKEVDERKIISDPNQGVRTRAKVENDYEYFAFISQIEPKNIDEAVDDDYWILAMQEELNQHERCQVWELVLRPSNHPIVGTKWVFRNKMDENGAITRKKS
ncbi:Uncharacterized protein TCM_013306 [Theobroma cacao]|uniref:Reverse transcriptase Ty1/copia-type domain-containing protein n=1 Tax=Theobroma cacao TaxID=3641 RepID=A0A061G3D6_THECC|nr:Uncharacterized protein TCM_013306 [Theobroma cacao]